MALDDDDELSRALRELLGYGDEEKQLRQKLADAEGSFQPGPEREHVNPLAALIDGLTNGIGAHRRGARVDAANQSLTDASNRRTKARSLLLNAMGEPAATDNGSGTPLSQSQLGPTTGGNPGADYVGGMMHSAIYGDEDGEPTPLERRAAQAQALDANPKQRAAGRLRLLRMAAASGDESIAPYASGELQRLAADTTYQRQRADKQSDTEAERTYGAQKENAEMQARANEGAATRDAEMERLKAELASRERTARIGAAARVATKKGAGGAQEISPGVYSDPDVSLSKEELAKTREALGAQSNISAKIAELRGLIEKNGSMLTGPDSAKAKELVASIKLDANKVAGLQRLTEKELELFKQQIPDPTTGGSLFTRNDTMLATLDQFKKDIDTRVASHLEAIGASKGARTSAQPTPTGRFKMVGGVKWVEMSDGSAQKAQ